MLRRLTSLAIVCALLVLLIAGCGDGSTATTSSDAATIGVTSTAVSVAATEPAADPTATEQPAEPTATPEPASAEVTEPITFSGIGKLVTDPFELTEPIVVAKYTHDGTANFIVTLINQETGQTANLLANEIGAADATTAFMLQDDGMFILEINADGAWTVDLTQPTPDSGDHFATPWEQAGSGSAVFYWLDIDKGVHTVTGTHDGTRNFIVSGFPTEGIFKFEQLVFNEIGIFDGEAALQVTDSGPMLIRVMADGNWTLKID